MTHNGLPTASHRSLGPGRWQELIVLVGATRTGSHEAPPGRRYRCYLPNRLYRIQENCFACWQNKPYSCCHHSYSAERPVAEHFAPSTTTTECCCQSEMTWNGSSWLQRRSHLIRQPARTYTHIPHPCI